MPHPISIRLDDELDVRLSRLARLTGRTKTFYLRQAIEQQIEDLEDLYLAHKVAERIAAGKEEVVTLEQVERDLGVEN